MEFAEGGDVLKKIERFQKEKRVFDEATIWKYFVQML